MYVRIAVTVERREDGSLRWWAEDLPGFCSPMPVPRWCSTIRNRPSRTSSPISRLGHHRSAMVPSQAFQGPLRHGLVKVQGTGDGHWDLRYRNPAF
jgi:hypothetical protein